MSIEYINKELVNKHLQQIDFHISAISKKTVRDEIINWFQQSPLHWLFVLFVMKYYYEKKELSKQTLLEEINEHFDSFNTHNRERVEYARGLTEQDYLNAKCVLDVTRGEMDRLFEAYDLFLSPSLGGESPVGLTEIRKATFSQLWTQMYTHTNGQAPFLL